MKLSIPVYVTVTPWNVAVPAERIGWYACSVVPSSTANPSLPPVPPAIVPLIDPPAEKTNASFVTFWPVRFANPSNATPSTLPTFAPVIVHTAWSRNGTGPTSVPPEPLTFVMFVKDVTPGPVPVLRFTMPATPNLTVSTTVVPAVPPSIATVLLALETVNLSSAAPPTSFSIERNGVASVVPPLSVPPFVNTPVLGGISSQSTVQRFGPPPLGAVSGPTSVSEPPPPSMPPEILPPVIWNPSAPERPVSFSTVSNLRKLVPPVPASSPVTIQMKSTEGPISSSLPSLPKISIGAAMTSLTVNVSSPLPPYTWTLATPAPAAPNVRVRPSTARSTIGAPSFARACFEITAVSALFVSLAVTTPPLYVITVPSNAGDRFAMLAVSAPEPLVTVRVAVGRATVNVETKWVLSDVKRRPSNVTTSSPRVPESATVNTASKMELLISVSAAVPPSGV